MFSSISELKIEHVTNAIRSSAEPEGWIITPHIICHNSKANRRCNFSTEYSVGVLLVSHQHAYNIMTVKSFSNTFMQSKSGSSIALSASVQLVQFTPFTRASVPAAAVLCLSTTFILYSLGSVNDQSGSHYHKLSFNAHHTRTTVTGRHCVHSYSLHTSVSWRIHGYRKMCTPLAVAAAGGLVVVFSSSRNMLIYYVWI